MRFLVILIFICHLSHAAPKLSEGNGTSNGETAVGRGRGNGTSNGIIIDPENFEMTQDSTTLFQIEEIPSYLKLTQEEIDKRREKLTPILGNYNLTLKEVYQYIDEQYNFDFYTNKDKADSESINGLLNSMGLYYLRDITRSKQLRHYAPSWLEGADEKAIPGAMTIGIGRKSIKMYPDGDCFIWDEGGIRVVSGFLPKLVKKGLRYKTLDLPMEVNTIGLLDEHVLDTGPDTYSCRYNSNNNKVFETPLLTEFLKGVVETEVKGLDAKIFLLTNNIYNDITDYYMEENQVDTTVVYPPFSDYAPIPSPIVYISKDAGANAIRNMLKEHAPLIHSYNLMFEQQMLPRSIEMQNLFRPYLDDSEYKDLERRLGKEKARSKIFQSFIELNSSILSNKIRIRGIKGPILFNQIVKYPKLIKVLIRMAKVNNN